MHQMNPDIKDLLSHIGYHEDSIDDIMHELDALFAEIGFERIKTAADSAVVAKDAKGLIDSLRYLMQLLENKGFYRPDFPTKLIRLLVNGLNLKREDIFIILEKSDIPAEEKKKEQEFLASCAAITQLGYILLRCLTSEVRAASSGPHVFLVMDGLSSDSMIFADFSIDSIREIETWRYSVKENFYHLENIEGLDPETSELMTGYYSFFHVTSGIGLSHNIRNNLGIAYDKAGCYEDAIKQLEEALRFDPQYIEVRNNLAVAYDKMGKCDEAVAELREVLRSDPDCVEAHSNLGNIYAKMEKYDEAVIELQEALRLDPGFAIAHNNLGHIYALQKKNDEAQREFMETLRINPDYAFAHSNLGNMYAEMGRGEDAIREFQEALRLFPEFPEAYYGLGSVYYSLGSYDRAAQAMIRAVYLDSELLECVPDRLLLKVRQGVSRLR